MCWLLFWSYFDCWHITVYTYFGLSVAQNCTHYLVLVYLLLHSVSLKGFGVNIIYMYHLQCYNDTTLLFFLYGYFIQHKIFWLRIKIVREKNRKVFMSCFVFLTTWISYIGNLSNSMPNCYIGTLIIIHKQVIYMPDPVWYKFRLRDIWYWHVFLFLKTLFLFKQKKWMI